MKVLTREQIDELLRLEKAATPGDWEAKYHHTWHIDTGNNSYPVPPATENQKDINLAAADAAFIAAIRNAAPQLLEMARLTSINATTSERLYRELESVKAERDALQAQVTRLQSGNAIESDYIDELALVRKERDALAVDNRLPRHPQRRRHAHGRGGEAMTLREKCEKAADELADVTGKRIDCETIKVADAIERVAKEFALVAVKKAFVGSPLLAKLVSHGLVTSIDFRNGGEEWIRLAIAAAERGE